MSAFNTPEFAAAAQASTVQTVLQVTVRVSADGDLRCVPHEAIVTGQNVLITFALQGTDWAFPSTGAVVVASESAQFPLPSWTLNAKQAALLDCNTEAGIYAYTVMVENTATGERRSLDPGIKNEV